MVLCVKVLEKNAEDTRRVLSRRSVINKNYKITSDSGYVYIPVSSDLDGFEIEDFDANKRENSKSVEDILGYKPTYEWLGDIVIVKADSDAEEIADAFYKSSHSPNSVVNKKTKVKGKTRVPEYDLVRGDDTVTVYKEYGYKYRIDVTSVYFTPRLSRERRCFMNDLGADDRTFDMFAGVGPYTIPAADIGESAVGVDINEIATDFMRENATLNSVEDSLSAINSDVRNVAENYENWADKVVMNLPHSADEFLQTAEIVVNDGGKIYMYDFVSDSVPADEVVGKVDSRLSDSTCIESYEMRKVRPYAPSVSNVCLEFDVRHSVCDG